ncbi:hypothetical protein A6U86_05365 [Rhizobium sp. AC27/96]|uniref:VOC family protein n=1 Tax=Rhizobium sp. AC27/96 TaxID=1841653 RepID=UPI0008274D65|nr:VOC family protein [Rhizobium sp. AC27/96]OCJ12453.1 hypothetical protein A6U86_05365 [Rhizobium sp. AC27/96]
MGGISLRGLPDSCGLRFHHFGLAVRQPDQAVRFLTALNYQLGEAVFDPLQNVMLAMGTHINMPDVELIYPADSGSGPIGRLLASHKDGLIYHLCYETDDLEESLSAFKNGGSARVACVVPPKPAVLFGGKPVSFYMVSGVGLIEIIDNAAIGNQSSET